MGLFKTFWIPKRFIYMITPTPEFWKVFKETNGALSSAEAIGIMQISLTAPNGNYMTMGSHRGKDALASTQSLKGGVYYLIDPMYEDEKIKSEAYNLIFDNAKNEIDVLGVAETSIEAIPKYAPYAYVFSDAGSHSDELPMAEVKMLEDLIVSGGIICFHDKGSQFTKVDEAYDYLLSTGKYEEIKIDWQPIFDYVKEHNLEEGNNSWHQYPELPHPPNFIGAVRRK